MLKKNFSLVNVKNWLKPIFIFVLENFKNWAFASKKRKCFNKAERRNFMEKKTRFSDVVALLLFYNYITQQEKEVPFSFLFHYQKIIEENLSGVEAMTTTRVEAFPYQFFSFVSKEQGKWYAIRKKNKHGIEDMYKHIEQIPIEVIIASQMENALFSIGLQLLDGELLRKEEQDLKRAKQLLL